ncbi:hypothetical protein GCM10028796_07540 [Ramlibacter monticola]
MTAFLSVASADITVKIVVPMVGNFVAMGGVRTSAFIRDGMLAVFPGATGEPALPGRGWRPLEGEAAAGRFGDGS